MIYIEDNRIITVTEPTEVSILYSAWKRWAINVNKLAIPFAIKAYGGDEILDGMYTISVFEVINKWKVVSHNGEIYTEGEVLPDIV